MNEDELIESQQRLTDAAKEIFNMPAGEIVLDQLKQKSAFNLSKFSSDALEMAYREGHRSVVLYILDLLTDKKVPPTEGE